MPFALGVLRLKPWELMLYTPREYMAASHGYVENYQQEQKHKQALAVYQAHLTSSLTAYAFHDPKKLPKLDRLMDGIK